MFFVYEPKREQPCNQCDRSTRFWNLTWWKLLHLVCCSQFLGPISPFRWFAHISWRETQIQERVYLARNPLFNVIDVSYGYCTHENHTYMHSHMHTDRETGFEHTPQPVFWLIAHQEKGKSIPTWILCLFTRPSPWGLKYPLWVIQLH